MSTLHTIGYDAFATPAPLVAALAEAGVERLVDVRAEARSRRRGFSKRALWDVLADAGIAYEHWPELGNPRAIRAVYKAGEVARGREEYRAYLLGPARASLDGFIASLGDEPTCLMCREADPADCHRDVLQEEIAARRDGLRIVRLT